MNYLDLGSRLVARSILIFVINYYKLYKGVSVRLLV